MAGHITQPHSVQTPDSLMYMQQTTAHKSTITHLEADSHVHQCGCIDEAHTGGAAWLDCQLCALEAAALVGTGCTQKHKAAEQ